MVSHFTPFFRKCAAVCLFTVHALSIAAPVFASGGARGNSTGFKKGTSTAKVEQSFPKSGDGKRDLGKRFPEVEKNKGTLTGISKNKIRNSKEVDSRIYGIGGPSQPEMSSFKSVDANNMVNLFTGDFSYNIPLMDVGGYPVNIFYDGNVGMEQEASWVGLGWNINPGTINRNMRGVPDDFNGEEHLEQTQKMKPNITWGGRLGADFEFIGVKAPFSADLGFSTNNYLGPAIEMGIKGTLNLSLAKNAGSEKSASVSLGLAANASSRGGLTISPSASLSANAYQSDKGLLAGVGLRLGTSYNSRSGIKELQLSGQMTANRRFSREQGLNASLASTSISFAKPSYIPAIRMPVTNTSYSGHFQLGAGLWGGYGSGEIEVYRQKSEIVDADVTIRKPMIGYLHYQKALNNENAVMDFTRLNDNEVTSKTPIISAPQYSYDVFSIQGEGTGGSIRAYRNDIGYVRDNFTSSRDKNLSAGVDIGLPGHIGANFNTIKTPSTMGEWRANNLLSSSMTFTDAVQNQENVYFRNPGETSVLNDMQYDNIGGENLVRFKLSGNGENPGIQKVLEKFDKSGSKISAANGGEINITGSIADRKKRTQVTSFLTAEEAKVVGLDHEIKSYTTNYNYTKNSGTPIFNIDKITRDAGDRRPKHISQINVTEANGRRYVYGIPVYNGIQKDFTFTVDGSQPDAYTGEDNFTFGNIKDATLESDHLKGTSNTDGYVQVTTTPAYSHSFLLTGLLSPDYVDATGDGITDDDLGSAVKFNYTKIAGVHRWRTPLKNGLTANFNAGKLSEKKDDKGIISYGEREQWYMHSIESKTMVALFTIENRDDGKGVKEIGNVNVEQKGINTEIDKTDKTSKLLKRIDLYSKSDLKENGITGARPVKTVRFEYDYSLCKLTPDYHPESSNAPSNLGKLTLKEIQFTYNGHQNRTAKSKYVFGYENSDGTGNPNYEFNGSDRWGTYKSRENNDFLKKSPGAYLKNAIYPYSTQVKATADRNAGAWALKKILLPSGGQIEVGYESDAYAYVQNKRAANMMVIKGFSNVNNPTVISKNLYERDLVSKNVIENDFVFITVSEKLYQDNATDEQRLAAETYARNLYIGDQTQLAFKLAVHMPKNLEFVHCYADIDLAAVKNFGIRDQHTIWVKLKKVDKYSPLSLTAVEYLREQLPGQAYTGYDVSEQTGIKQFSDMAAGLLKGIRDAFTDPLESLRFEGKAQLVDVENSFARLSNPSGYKFGGGHRVRSVVLKDNWIAMNKKQGELNQTFNSQYGKIYEYSTTEVINGKIREISSGVASYEPSLGGEENPFQTIFRVADKLPLGPASYGAIEMPVLDAFFPAPSVGYSKVTVKSLPKTNAAGKALSGIGKQITEFYTAKDFPVYYNHTSLDPLSDLQEHQSSFGMFFYKSAFDSRALSQGFIVATNDMHGKMKSQTSYAGNDTKTPVHYTENFYRNTGVKGFSEKFDFVSAANEGAITEGNMGIDIELMTDTREFSVKSSSLEIQAQVDLFPVVLPLWLPFIWPVVGKTESNYRAVTTSKVINYHSIVDSVVVIDKGSQVSTKNLVYDAETGDVIVSRTNNQFKDPVYNTSYPAWWAYSGMGLAYKNIDAVYTANFKEGAITTGLPTNIFESGDELYVIAEGSPFEGDCASNLNLSTADILWAFNKNKNTTSLTDPNPQFVFIDSKGSLFNRNNVKFKIVRSGKRNMLDAKVATVTTLASPIAVLAPETSSSPAVKRLRVSALPQFNNAAKTINATAIEYKEKWQTDNDIIKRYVLTSSSTSCLQEVESCNGYLEKGINPYRKGLLGTFRPFRSKIFYDGRQQNDPTASTNLRQDGFLNNFNLYWDFNSAHLLVPDANSTQWIYQSEITKINARGMELETKDANNIYTAAQYGYRKSMPVAIVNNSRNNEMLYESFEDNAYSESLNTTTTGSCSTKGLDLLSPPNTQVVSSDNAHSGKYVLAVNGTTKKDILIDQNTNPNYSLVLGQKKPTVLNTLGGTDFVSASTPSDAFTAPGYAPPTYFYGNLPSSNDAHVEIRVAPKDNFEGSTRSHSYTLKWETYIEIKEEKEYNCFLGISNQNTNYVTPNFYNSVLKVWIRNQEGGEPIFQYFTWDRLANSYTEGTKTVYSNTNYKVKLCPGVYKVEGEVVQNYNAPVSSQWNTALLTYFHWSCDANSEDYKTLDASTVCTITTPIAAAENMLNPKFSLTPTKKMLFSAWVRQGSSTGAKVQLEFNGVAQDPIMPSGPVIEGWQKIEGEFMVPQSATTAALTIIKPSGSPTIYLDDIRIHPYNANMKSYVYDPVNLRLVAELDANNYGSFYEYDEEGTLIRTKAETKEGVKTLTETRSARQRSISTFE